jgi:hypothetical protein
LNGELAMVNCYYSAIGKLSPFAIQLIPLALETFPIVLPRPGAWWLHIAVRCNVLGFLHKHLKIVSHGEHARVLQQVGICFGKVKMRLWIATTVAAEVVLGGKA